MLSGVIVQAPVCSNSKRSVLDLKKKKKKKNYVNLNELINISTFRESNDFAHVFSSITLRNDRTNDIKKPLDIVKNSFKIVNDVKKVNRYR